jgi:Cof subfamily protein (haloacid dehalogenase superfamily)
VTLPRLVAIDLDGTLLRADESVSGRSVAALSRIAEMGVAIVFVTGRPVRWMPRVYEQLGTAYPTICSNGAVLYDGRTDRVSRSWPVPAGAAAEVCRRLRAAIPSVAFAAEVDGGRRMLHESAYPLRWDANHPQVHTAELAELLAQPAVKLLARSAIGDSDTFTDLVASTVDREVEVTHSSFSGLVEMSAAGVNKGSGLAAMTTALDLDAADVLAFGDMPNDVPMLAWAGRSVAVANAHPAVLAVARELTLSNEDDGVATYLESLS